MKWTILFEMESIFHHHMFHHQINKSSILYNLYLEGLALWVVLNQSLRCTKFVTCVVINQSLLCSKLLLYIRLYFYDVIYELKLKLFWPLLFTRTDDDEQEEEAFADLLMMLLVNFSLNIVCVRFQYVVIIHSNISKDHPQCECK